MANDLVADADGSTAPDPCGILFASGPHRVCGRPSTGIYRGTCECGGVSERPLCAGHAEAAHMCSGCFYDGHACDVTLELLDRAAMPGQVNG